MPMSAQPSSSVTRFYEELWNGGKLDIAPQILQPRCTTHQLLLGATAEPIVRTPEEIAQHVIQWQSGFSDFKFVIRQIVLRGDRCACESTFTGTHDGPFMGISATNRRVSIESISIYRLEEGRIAEDWVLTDLYSLLNQLGVLPPLPELLRQWALGRPHQAPAPAGPIFPTHDGP